MLKEFFWLLCTTASIHADFFDFFRPQKTYTTSVPTTQSYINDTVVLVCSEWKKERLYEWKREGNLPLPKNSVKEKGKLAIHEVTPLDAGLYICQYNSKKGSRIKRIRLSVKQSTPNPTFTTSPNLYTNTEEITKLRNVSECEAGFDNLGLQTDRQCRALVSLYECNNGQKVNKSLRCNRKRDCEDGSDEVNCEFWPPKITKLPELQVDLYCGSDEHDKFEMLRLDCEFVGHPEPLVKWKKYDGHVPSKCLQVSNNGHGILLCPNFTQSDQGAYSCVAENSIGSSESQPKSIAKCKNFLPCNGFKVKNEEEIEHCLQCFCSGKTDKCQNIKSKMKSNRLTFPDTLVTLYAKSNGEVVTVPTYDLSTNQLNEIRYYELPKDGLIDNSLLKSYGRNMRIPRYSGKIDFMSEAPDLIMEGNGVSLFYNFHIISPSSTSVDVRFWPGNWHYLNKTAANRQDLMHVLSNVDRFLFRGEYLKGNVENWGSGIYINLETSTIGDFSTSVSYIEKCTCPEGYVGLSCESCATGYQRTNTESGFICEKIQCESKDGYFLSGNECVKSRCNVNGSLSLFPDFHGKCKCKEGMTGDTCNQQITCPPSHFRVGNSNDCVKCWCSGVTDQCNSSSLHRTEISSLSMGGYNSSNGRNFWLLPGIFSGNKLTSYGGHIKYALTYISGTPKQNEPLSVELLTVNDVTLTFTHSSIDKSTFSDEKIWVVLMNEAYWRKSDKTIANRSEFLSALTQLKAVYVESPYHLSAGKVNLSWVRMSDAKQQDNVMETTELATAVEQCHCPAGYAGLSCESCAQGYYREKATNQCVKCYCENCDPIEGCLGCPVGSYRDNPLTETRPVCKPCECNGREVKCGKDTNNIIYCLCKSGFSGLKCENSIAFSQNSSHLTLKISPSKLTNNVAGSEAPFNCSYDSGEKLKLSFMKIYPDRMEGPFAGNVYPVVSTKNGFQGAMSFTTVLDEDLTDVGCFVHNMNDKEVGRLLATIQTAGTQPVKITNCYSDYTYVKVTKSKDFICETTGSPKPVTTWYTKKPNEPMQKVDSTDGVYSIGTVELSHNGTTFICEAENSVGDKDVCSTVLIVEKNCDVVHIAPKTLQIQEGDTINLHCRTTSNNSVSWFRPDYRLPPRTVENSGNLTIVNATLEDAGNYTCQTLSSENRYINQTAWVNVTEKLVPPLIFLSSNDVMLDVGDYFSVNCWASGKPTPNVTWTKLTGIPGRNLYSYGGNLTITRATLEDSGIYECEAKSKAGKEIARIFVDVKKRLEPPKIEISSTSISPTEGDSARIYCRSVMGQPTPVLQWLKEHPSTGEFRYYQNGTILEFTNISKSDRGIYQCRGANAAGVDVAYVEINVMFIPEITVSDESISVYENEEITVKCSAVGNPRPRLMWINQLKGNQKRDLGDNDILASMYLNPPEVSITLKASSDLYGLICIATNDVGEARKMVPISILPELVLHEKDVQFVPIGSYHEIFCHGCPGEPKWEKEDGQLFGDECEIPNGLMIPSVQIQHNATYACTCTGDKKFKKTFGIIVTGYVPKFTQDPKSYIVLPAKQKSNSGAFIEISFKTNRENGLLLKDENNEFALYLQDNKTGIILHLEGGKRHHFLSSVELKHRTWYSLVVEIDTAFAKLIIYDVDSSVLEEKEEHFKDFGGIFSTAPSNFFVGGAKHNPKNVHHTQFHMPSLDGCISRLNIDGHFYDLIRDGTYSTSVGLCKRCSERINPCNDKGKCLEAPTQFGFVCVCPEHREFQAGIGAFRHGTNEENLCPSSCVGRNCDRQLNLCGMLNPCNRNDLNLCSNKVSSLSCSCSLGYQGFTCEKEEQSSFCVRGDGYVKLPSKYLYRPSILQPEIIEIHFSIEKPKGLLLWRGDSENHIAITINGGYVNYIYYNQGTRRVVTAQLKLSLYENHSLIATRTNDTIILQINSEVLYDHNKFTTNRVFGNIYLGGAPRNILEYKVKSNGLYGCINSVSFGRQPRINFRENVLEALNIRQLKSHTFSNKVRDNLSYDKTESESVDDDQSSSDYQ